MKLPQSLTEWRYVWRYYQAGIVNTLFGYGLFAALIAAGFNMYGAQAVGHVLGVAFNWFTYSRHAFRGAEGSAIRFVISYVVNYLLSVLVLRLVSYAIHNPYAAGLLTVVFVSIINYFILSRYVFGNKK